MNMYCWHTSSHLLPRQCVTTRGRCPPVPATWRTPTESGSPGCAVLRVPENFWFLPAAYKMENTLRKLKNNTTTSRASFGTLLPNSLALGGLLVINHILWFDSHVDDVRGIVVEFRLLQGSFVV